MGLSKIPSPLIRGLASTSALNGRGPPHWAERRGPKSGEQRSWSRSLLGALIGDRAASSASNSIGSTREGPQLSALSATWPDDGSSRSEARPDATSGISRMKSPRPVLRGAPCMQRLALGFGCPQPPFAGAHLGTRTSASRSDTVPPPRIRNAGPQPRPREGAPPA